MTANNCHITLTLRTLRMCCICDKYYLINCVIDTLLKKATKVGIKTKDATYWYRSSGLCIKLHDLARNRYNPSFLNIINPFL